MSKLASPTLSSVVSRFASRVEALESRIAPAIDVLAIGGTTVASFTDADGDLITVRISGSAGSVDLNEIGNTNGIVEDGEAIGSIAITGASSDFVISISVDSTGASNGVVALGEVTSNKTIFAFNTIPDISGGVPVSDFQLLSYKGPGFSAGGGLNVNSILGGGDGVGLALAALPAGTTINARADINGTVTVTGAVGGALIANTISSATVTLGGLTSTGSITTALGLSSDVEIKGAVAGDVTIGGAASGAWATGAVLPSAGLQAASWSSLTVNGTMAGQVAAVNGGIGDLTVKGSLARSAQITSSSDATINITGAVPGKARIDVGGSATVVVGKSFAGTILADSDIDLDVANGTVSGHLGAESAIKLNAKSINKLSASFDDTSTFTVAGGVSNSKFFGGDSTLTLTATGAMTKTVIALDGLEATTGSLNGVQVEGSEGTINMTVNGSVSNSSITSGSEDVTMTVSGNVTKSVFSAPESGVSLEVTGSVSNVKIAAADDILLNVGGSLTASELVGSRLTLDVTKAISGVTGAGGSSSSEINAATIVKSTFTSQASLVVTAQSVTNSSFIVQGSSGDLTATIDGNVSNSRLVAERGDVNVTIGGSSAGLYVDSASDVTVSVGGNLSNSRLFGDEGANVVLAVGNKLSNTIVSCGSEEISATIGGDVVNSKFFSAESPVTLTVGGNLVASQVSGSAVSAAIGGSVTASRLETNDNTLSLTVGGNLTKSGLESVDGLVVGVGGDALDVQMGAAGTSNIAVGKNFKGTFANSGGNLIFAATGNVVAGSVISNAGDARVSAAAFDGTLNARALDFVTTGSVGAMARLQATSVTDLNADTTAFSIGGNFAGRLAVTGNFTTGAGASAVLVGGTVQKTARIAIGGNITGGATQYEFSDAFLGTLQVNGDIDQDLRFGGNLNSLFVGEQINGDVRVIGKVAVIVAGNTFTETDANDGTFRDGAGNITGTLDTDSGHGKVISTI